MNYQDDPSTWLNTTNALRQRVRKVFAVLSISISITLILLLTASAANRQDTPGQLHTGQTSQITATSDEYWSAYMVKDIRVR
jgi:hypothetical protein